MSSKVAMYEALLSGVGQRPSDVTYLQAHRRSLGSRPLRIILAAYEIPPTSRLPASDRIRFNEGFRASGAHLLDLSTNGKLISTDTGAFVQFEKPDTVIAAIREVCDQYPWSLPMSLELDGFDASIGADYHDGFKLAGLTNNSPPLQLRDVDLVHGATGARLRGPETILEHIGSVVSGLD